jgi:hypothetical protein
MKATALIMVFLSLAMAGCAKPNKVWVSESPTKGLFFTVETYYGRGAPSPDITKVYAHFERHGNSGRIAVLEGEDLTVSKIVWNAPHEDTICIDRGFTDTFRNQVTLIVGNSLQDSVTIHSRLREHCSQAGLGDRKRAMPSHNDQGSAAPN